MAWYELMLLTGYHHPLVLGASDQREYCLDGFESKRGMDIEFRFCRTEVDWRNDFFMQ
jgi:hypothetical protein